MLKNWVRRKSLWMGALLLLILLSSAAAGAAPGVSLTTRYPDVMVNPGERVSFSLDLTNGLASGQTIHVAVVEAPEGWETRLQGGGRLVNAVHAAAGETAYVTLEVRVPAAAEPGEYSLKLRAEGSGGRDELPLTLRVTEGNAGASQLTVQYPVLKGPSGATFEFRLTLNNALTEQQLFALNAEVPEGWQASFKPGFGSREIASIPVEGGSSETLNLSVEVPDRVEAGEYAIPVQAVAPGVQAETEVKVIISGSYDMQLVPVTERFSYDATAGDTTRVQLRLHNSGTAPLNDIRLSSSQPQDWEVSMEPDNIDVLQPGEARDVTVSITPKSQAIAGDYLVTLRSGAGGTSDEADLRVTVKTPTLWGWAGFLLIAAAIGGTFTVFRTYGRR